MIIRLRRPPVSIDFDGVVRPPAWMTRAACAADAVNPEWFFPTTGELGDHRRRSILVAKHVCWGCPVTGECLEYALAFEDAAGEGMAGIWGARTRRERRGILRQRHRDAS